jgi:integrase
VIKANVKAIAAARKPADGHAEKSIAGHRGLVLRIYASGERVMYFRYRLNGRLTRIRLGAFPTEITLEDAIAKRSELKGQLRKGIDPAGNSQRVKRERVLAPTITDFVSTYITRYAKATKRSWRADELMLTKDVIPEWGKLKVNEIGRQDVAALVDKISDRGAQRQAGKVLATVRRMLAYAVERDVITINPATGVKPPSAVSTSDRVLSDDELRDFWLNITESSLRPALRDVFRLQLLTGTRVGEVLGIEWSEVDEAAKTWLIPKAKAKNKTEHLIPLSGPAWAIVEANKRDGLLWPTKTRKGEVVQIQTERAAHELAAVMHELLPDRSYVKTGPDDKGRARATFTSHDLRRTVETRLAALGIAKETRDRVLNHKDRSVGGVHYNRHDYLQEKRSALDKWSRELLRIATGETAKIIELPRATG